MMIAQVLEAAMLICFGLSWPINAYKNYKARTAAGTSWQFILLITLGYVAGIGAKFAADAINWVLIVYFLNLLFLAANWAVYFRNCRLDRERLDQASKAIESEASVRSVLVATDGSKASLDAIGFAAGSLDLRKVPSVKVFSVAESSGEAAVARALSAVDQAGELLSGMGIGFVKKVGVGETCASIVNEAIEGKADIVVMGSRGLSGVSGLLLGSVSRAVTEKLSCPVLVVK